MTSKKNPKEKSVRGRVNKIGTGFTTALANPANTELRAKNPNRYGLGFKVMVAIPNMNRCPQALNQAQVIREYIWCQEVLAELAGLHRNYVGHVERGEVNVGLENLMRLAGALGVSVRELVDRCRVRARD